MLAVTSKVKRKPRFRAIADELRAAIYKGKPNAGDKLQTQRQLSERFGASRVVVREALRSLEQEGLIYTRRGRGGGNFVASPNARPVQDSLVAMLRTGKITMENLAEARSICEPEMTRLAALRATAEDLAKMAEVIRCEEEALRAKGPQEEFTLAFHRLVAEATKNPVLVTAMNAIVNTLVAEVRQLSLNRPTQRSIVDFHQKIYRALQDHHSDRAFELMSMHVIDVQGRLARLLGSRRSPRRA